jgi:hypothetical protein
VGHQYVDVAEAARLDGSIGHDGQNGALYRERSNARSRQCPKDVDEVSR